MVGSLNKKQYHPIRPQRSNFSRLSEENSIRLGGQRSGCDVCEPQLVRFLHVTAPYSLSSLGHRARHKGSSSRVHSGSSRFCVPHHRFGVSSIPVYDESLSLDTPRRTPPSHAAQQRHTGRRGGAVIINYDQIITDNIFKTHRL